MQIGLQTRLIIHEILKKLKYSNITFNQIFSEKTQNKNISKSDKKMIHSVVLNAMRHCHYIDEIINKFTRKIKKKDDSYFLLLSSITQLIVLNIKPFAVINSTVELTKNTKIRASTKFINGILRNINRKNILLKYKIDQLPSWFIRRIQHLTIKQKNNFAISICKEPDLHIVFKNKIDLINFSHKNIPTTEYSTILKSNFIIEEIEGYKEGKWWIQDFSTMMPLYLNKNIKNKNVIDLCSAPGGKTFQLISYGAKVKAIEKYKDKALKLKTNLKRLNFNCEIEIVDATKIKDSKKYDIVVLDAPCTSIGTIRRHPEILYRKSNPDFDKVLFLQKKLLERAKYFLNDNGMIIYMVCSFFKEEGQEQINNFLKRNKKFGILKFSSNNSQNLIDKNGFYSVMPTTLDNGHNIDGFFAARVIKNE